MLRTIHISVVSYLHITCDIEISLTYSLISCNMSVKLAHLYFNENIVVEPPLVVD